jgi:hypothetical protein
LWLSVLGTFYKNALTITAYHGASGFCFHSGKRKVRRRLRSNYDFIYFSLELFAELGFAFIGRLCLYFEFNKKQ